MSPIAGLLVEAAHIALQLLRDAQLEGREPTLDEVKAAGIVNADRIAEVEAEIKARPD